jgi:hemerythrin-like domain-containing protein
MKRHPSLVLLSKDHHDGLLLAVRLRQGQSALTRLWSHDPFWQAQFVINFFNENLAQHFEAEERFLFSCANETPGDHSRIVHRLINEHHEMKRMTESLKHSDEKVIRENLGLFGKLLEQHIHCEERELFPLLEQLLPEETLLNIGHQIEQYYKKP